jgi:prephenate dehydrogenase
MQLLVVGAGAMGRWFAESVVGASAAGVENDVEVAFADTDAAVAESAAADLDARRVAVDGSERFDVVCLAVPISVADASVAAQADRVREAMVDVTGVMETPLAAMRTHLPDGERVSFHPLFAPSNAPGSVAVVADRPGPTTDRLRAALSAAGNDLFETTPDEHDRAMETVQASAHAAVIAYALAAREVRPEFHTPVSAALTDVVETVTSGTPRVYREIQEAFDGADRIADAATRLAAADDETFDALYREAAGGAGRADDDHTDGERHEERDSGRDDERNADSRATADDRRGRR